VSDWCVAYRGHPADLTTHGVGNFGICTRRPDFSATAKSPLTPNTSSAFVITMCPQSGLATGPVGAACQHSNLRQEMPTLSSMSAPTSSKVRRNACASGSSRIHVDRPKLNSLIGFGTPPIRFVPNPGAKSRLPVAVPDSTSLCRGQRSLLFLGTGAALTRTPAI
jgi:hypothetical protein